MAAAPLLDAAPRLRLARTTLGPIVIAQGSNGPAQRIEAGNTGDGSLALTFQSSATWLSASAGGAGGCATIAAPTCVPVNISLNTGSLARGAYSATLQVRDANAEDAPQTIIVSIQVGSGIPDSITMLVPPNGTPVTRKFTSAGQLTYTTSTQGSGGARFSVNMDAAGSFATSRSYTVTATAPEGTPTGNVPGAIQITGSTVGAIDTPRTVPVTLQVTSSPIAAARWPFIEPATFVDTLRFRIMQGAQRQEKWVQMVNLGLGNLAVSGATAATTSGGNWLTATVDGGFVKIAADPANVAPGAYAGTVTVASNAANASLAIPVSLEISATAPARILVNQETYSLSRGGVRNNATFAADEPVAPGGLLAVFGEYFTAGADAAASALPLPTTLAGARVFVNDQPVPVYFVASASVLDQPGQITFQLPYDTPVGEARVRVDRDGQRGNTVIVRVNQRVPRLMVSINDYAVATFADTALPWPATPGVTTRPARRGDTLIFYALGLGPTTPTVVSGAASPSSPLAEVPRPTFYFGGTGPIGDAATAEPFFAGLTPGFVGLYQLNVVVPDTTPRGERIPVFMGYLNNFSNRVFIAVQ